MIIIPTDTADRVRWKPAWRTLLLGPALATLLLAPAAALHGAETPPRRPNIVYIIPDDQTYRDFGFMGSKDALTPHIDRLAAQSARFVNGYVPTSLCSPSLGVMLTGRYPHQSGLHYNHPPPGNSGFNKMKSRADYEDARRPAFDLIRSQPTLPRALGQLGYTSFQTGKFWEGHFSNAGFTEGMTTFEPAPHLSYTGVNRTLKDGAQAAHGNGDHGLAIGRETMQPIADFLDRTGQGKPFFLWYAPYLPHQPHNSPERYHALHRQRGAAEHRIPYLASISQFDDTVGELMSILEKRNLLQNTLIILCADNGWSPGTERMKNSPKEFEHTRESKYSPFDDGLRTPILISLPGTVKPATHAQPVSSVDLLPTVLAAIGEPRAVADLPGRSLWPAAIGETALKSEPVFGEIYPGDASSLGHPSRDIAYRWIRDGDFKLIVPHTHHGSAPWGGYLAGNALYNVATDPEEKHNLAGLDPDRVQTLRRKLDAWWTPGDDLQMPKPNVLFIAIDDLNDWVGCLGGHPQAKTPNIDRLAQRGVLFANAHCAAPLCNPSRSAVFSGRQPFETGVLANDEANIRKMRPDLVLIPQHFKQSGYRTFGTGKLLHASSVGLFDEEFFPDLRWSPFDAKQVDYTDDELPGKATANPRHVTSLKGNTVVLPLNRMPSDRAPGKRGGESFDWGPLDVDDADMGDGQIATWAAERLSRAHDQPFFVAVGFYRPHIPLFAPRKYFDLFNGIDITLPPVKADDLDDLSEVARRRALEAETAGSHATVVKFNQWQAAVKSYLACVAFVDAQVGRLLDALDAGPNARTTHIVLWGDHGWHLGEKQHWGKWTGWQRSTHVPLIVAPSRDAPADRYRSGARCSEPVGLIDLYPSLIELCALPARDGLSGQSLVPLMQEPNRPTNRAVLTTFDAGNYSVTAARWHYIRYADGSEELYDQEKDPHEWINLATRPEHAERKAGLAKSLPKSDVSPARDKPSATTKKKRKQK